MRAACIDVVLRNLVTRCVISDVTEASFGPIVLGSASAPSGYRSAHPQVTARDMAVSKLPVALCSDATMVVGNIFTDAMRTIDAAARRGGWVWQVREQSSAYQSAGLMAASPRRGPAAPQLQCPSSSRSSGASAPIPPRSPQPPAAHCTRPRGRLVRARGRTCCPQLRAHHGLQGGIYRRWSRLISVSSLRGRHTPPVSNQPMILSAILTFRIEIPFSAARMPAQRPTASGKSDELSGSSPLEPHRRAAFLRPAWAAHVGGGRPRGG